MAAADPPAADPPAADPPAAENRLPVVAAVLVAAALQLTLPRRLSLPPRELLPALELLLLTGLTVANPLRITRTHPGLRAAGLALVAVLTLANAVSAALLAARLVAGTAGEAAGPLLLAGVNIYLTNIIAFGLWFWEFDRGGPFARSRGGRKHGDFLFVQQANPGSGPSDWRPQFVDYLYLAYTNATAFSPTDTLPLTRGGKMLMAVQSAVALVVVVVVLARAVSLLR